MATNRTHILLRIHDTMCNGSARSFAPCPHSFLTILLGGVETVTIHFLFRTNKGGLALRVDAVFANVVPFVAYPVVLFGLFLDALVIRERQTWRMCSIILVVVVAIFGCFAMRVAHGHARAIAKQLSLARAIATGDDTEFADEAAEESTLLRNAFDSFDADGSESIDQDEARRLLNLMYPLKSRSFHKKALSAIPDTSSVSYDQFDHLVREWREMAQTDGATAEGNLQSVQSSAQQAGKHAGTCLSLLTSSVSSVRSHGRPQSQVRHTTTTTTTTRTSDTAVGNVQADSANASGGAEDVRDSSSLALEISSDRGL